MDLADRIRSKQGDFNAEALEEEDEALRDLAEQAKRGRFAPYRMQRRLRPDTAG
jgi:hypothetical protein